MKTFLTILACVLLVSVFFIPSDGASLSTFFMWLIWCLGALFIANTIFKETSKWNDEKN